MLLPPSPPPLRADDSIAPLPSLSSHLVVVAVIHIHTWTWTLANERRKGGRKEGRMVATGSHGLSCHAVSLSHAKEKWKGHGHG